MAADGITSTAAQPTADAGRVTHRLIATGSLAGVIFWFAYDGGSYDIASWTAVAIVVWWIIALGLVTGVWPVERLGKPTRRVLGLLTTFAAFTGLSAFWASGAETAYQALDLALLYAGIPILVALVTRRSSAASVGNGIVVGLVAVSVLALASRLFRGLFPTDRALQTLLPDAHTRLSYPVNYWNGLAVLVALSCPLLLERAVTASSPLMRALSLAPFPVLATTIYLTSSRTGVVTFVSGIAIFLVLSGRRWVAAGATLTALAASLVAILYVAQQHRVVDGPLDSSALQAHKLAVVLIVVCSLMASFYALACRRLAGYEPPAAATRVIRYALPAALIVALVAADPVRRIRAFVHPPPTLSENSYIESHLLSTNGTWRWQLWRAAMTEFREHPIVGNGAGSFEAWWSQHGRSIGYVANPHSLYFETLGDLGLIGYALLTAAFVTAAVIGIRRARASRSPHRESTAAVTAGFISYSIAAGVDWMWELPAVSIVGMVLLGLCVGPATESIVEDDPPSVTVVPRAISRRHVLALRRREARLGRRRRAVRTVVLVVALAAIAVECDLYATNAALADSQKAAARGDLTSAGSYAKAAHRLEPWAASPYVQLALVEESQGRLGPARRSIEQAVSRNPDDWRSWLVATRIETDLGDIRAAERSLARLRLLNPELSIKGGA